jgi:FKBP-type peptidyl-prolyl cis-trans isomerase (trigger factor)
MEGFAEGLLGSKAGDLKSIGVKFPTRPSGPGAVLSGKEAVFDVLYISTVLYSI